MGRKIRLKMVADVCMHFQHYLVTTMYNICIFILAMNDMGIYVTFTFSRYRPRNIFRLNGGTVLWYQIKTIMFQIDSVMRHTFSLRSLNRFITTIAEGKKMNENHFI